ncbi:hypothetical protein APHAL10511_005446 [Amanita phalloides]|nr:hypothetical protein APHAL10511_005446 [Amanita phalloides]
MHWTRALATLFILGSHWARTSFIPSLESLRTVHYRLTDVYAGEDFFNCWDWFTGDDPTHGRVNYVGLDEAQKSNLTFVTDDGIFYMKADDTNIVPDNARGRNSIRIQSRKAYGDSLIILELQHMPAGCATWPAFWTISQTGPWPHGGEIDIIEGVNLNTNNQATLHTTPNCTQCMDRLQTGQSLSLDCNTAVNYNQGCGVQFSQPNSYGTDFNNNGGGFYMMQRSEYGVHVWLRQLWDLPWGVAEGAERLSVNLFWEPPDVTFDFTSCDYLEHFDDHAMIFDLTFCGDWAGNAFATSGCPSTNCTSYVDDNPSAFSEAYWAVKVLRVYTPSHDDDDDDSSW